MNREAGEAGTDALARAVLDAAQTRGWMLAAAESCTGGLVAAALTDIPGSSAVFERGWVTYANPAKQELLGVPAETLARFGAVSGPTAAAMAEGALARSPAHLAVSVTGVAGPGGGSPEKPVGLVWFACALRGQSAQPTERRFGDLGRGGVRDAATRFALELLLDRLT
jgi:nicotinamide-nucleotide amidase